MQSGQEVYILPKVSRKGSWSPPPPPPPDGRWKVVGLGGVEGMQACYSEYEDVCLNLWAYMKCGGTIAPAAPPSTCHCPQSTFPGSPNSWVKIYYQWCRVLCCQNKNRIKKGNLSVNARVSTLERLCLRTPIHTRLFRLLDENLNPL